MSFNFPCNQVRAFPPDVSKKLNHYVYGLCDPRNSRVFYVGKGQGNRVFSHFEEAEKRAHLPAEQQSRKTRQILDVWADDLDVKIFIIRYGIDDEKIAFEVEAAAIDAYGISLNGEVDNEQSGHHSQSRGVIDLESALGLVADPVMPDDAYPKIFLFPVQKALDKTGDPYQATRTTWRVASRWRQEPRGIAIGIAAGKSIGVFEIDNWSEVPGTDGKVEFCAIPSSGTLGQTCAFNRIGSPLYGKNWLTVISHAMGFWQRGNYLIIEIIRVNESLGFRFLRGSSSRGTTYLF
jgi:uncharacterized protein